MTQQKAVIQTAGMGGYKPLQRAKLERRQIYPNFTPKSTYVTGRLSFPFRHAKDIRIIPYFVRLKSILDRSFDISPSKNARWGASFG